MVDEITTNPKRSDSMINKDGSPTRQMIDWFDDIELRINEIVSVLGSGGFTGPNGAVPDNLVSFADATGNQGKDSGVPSAKVVEGPDSATDGNIALYDGETGKLIKNSSLSPADIDGDFSGPDGAVDENLVSFDNITGKIGEDSGISKNDVVTGPQTAPGGTLAEMGGTGRILSDSGLKVNDVVLGPESSVVGNLPSFSNADGNELQDSGIPTDEVGDVKGPGSSTTNRLAIYANGTGKLIKVSSILESAVGDVKGPASSTTNRLALYANTTGKLLKVSSILESAIVTPSSSNTFTNKGYNANGAGNNLSNVDIGNSIAASEAEAEAGVQNSKLLTSLRVAQAISFQKRFRGALAFRTSDILIPSGSPVTSITFNADSYDTDNIHDVNTNTDRLVVPAGVTKVRLTGCITWKDNETGQNVGQRNIAFFQGGTIFIGFPQVVYDTTDSPALPTIQNMVSPVVSVVGGNFFTLVVFQNSGSTLTVKGGFNQSTWFSMEVADF